jgi:hypothetical protein
MKKVQLFSALLVGAGISASAQTAKLEIIHNSADAAASVVDIYVNGELFVDDFAFRTTTGFVDVPAGVELNVAVAPGNSTSAAQALATFPFTLEENESYIAIASGIVSPTGYSPATAFNVDVFVGGRQEAIGTGTDVLVYHGATDAPAVDVDEVGVGAGVIISDLAYSQFQGYASFMALDYVLQIQPAGTGTPVAAFAAPLATLELEGAAITVLASGFLDPSENSDGAAFGLFVSLGVEGALIPLPTPTARVEIIHNAADAAAAEVDVYVNGELAIDDFAFRTTTGFIDLPANMPLSVAIAAGNSTSVGDALATFPLELMNGETYIVVANGIVSQSGYNPAPGFDLDILAGGREVAQGPGTDVLVYHGATDAPAVDVEEVGAGAGLIVEGAAYSQFTDYLELLTGDYVIQVQPAGTGTPVAAYAAPLATLELEGAAVTVLASGFLDPSENSDGAAFGLYVSLGVAGDLIPLPTPTARVEIIHNAADLNAAEVDVYVNGELAIDNFAFRTTTGFIDLPANMPLSVAVAAGNSTSVGDALATFPLELMNGETYIVIANGIVSPTGYTPATPFALDIFTGGREAAENAGETDILVYHGATDAPTVDVIESAVGAGTIVDDISYGEFQGYLSVGPAAYQLDITPAAGSPVLVSYEANTQPAVGAALTILASGFLDPAANSNGPAFGLWYSTGEAGELIPLPVFTSISEVSAFGSINLYPNPTNDNATLRFDVVNEGRVALDVIDVIGNSVLSMDLGSVGQGGRTVQLPTQNLTAGMYLVRLMTESGQSVQRLQVVK